MTKTRKVELMGMILEIPKAEDLTKKEANESMYLTLGRLKSAIVQKKSHARIYVLAEKLALDIELHNSIEPF